MHNNADARRAHALRTLVLSFFSVYTSLSHIKKINHVKIGIEIQLLKLVGNINFPLNTSSCIGPLSPFEQLDQLSTSFEHHTSYIA